LKTNNQNGSSHSDRENYLTTLSPQDKPWDTHKARNDLVSGLYKETIFDGLVSQINACGAVLEFGLVSPDNDGCTKLKLKSARFCRSRFCPICQWRRSLMWFSRFVNALPFIQDQYPKHRYIFLTLTVKNCQLEELNSTIKLMNKGWDRMSKKKDFPAVGFAKSIEVTRNRTELTVHPHFHILMMVSPDYFAGRNYINYEKWMELWKSALRISYDPIVNVKVVKPKSQSTDDSKASSEQDLQATLGKAIRETFKYSVKEQDLIGKNTKEDKNFLEELTVQMKRVRAISLGGVFKQYLSEEDPKDYIDEGKADEKANEDMVESLYFGWRENYKRYVKFTNV
jgi:plasmid rolling circle replication initiator protein Rep